MPADAPPPLVDQSVPPHGVWRAEADPDTPLRGQMTWEPAEPDASPRGPLFDQPHDSGVWQIGPGQVALWRPAPSDGEN